MINDAITAIPYMGRRRLHCFEIALLVFQKNIYYQITALHMCTTTTIFNHNFLTIN